MSPDDSKWHYLLGVLLAEGGELETAGAAFRRSCELKPDYAPVWMRLTWRAMDRNDMKAALDNISRYIQLRPRDAMGHVQRARVHLHRQDWTGMQQDLRRAQSLGPIGKQGHRLLGVLYKHLGRDEDSEFHLWMSAEQQAGGRLNDPAALEIEQLKTYQDPLVVRFVSLVERERYREATLLADELLALHEGTPDYGLFCDQISICYRGVNDYQTAYRYAKMTRDALPKRPIGYVSLAFALGGLGRFDEALVEADRALKIDALDVLAHYVRGVVLIELAIGDHLRGPQQQAAARQRLAQAVDDLSQAVDDRPLEVKYLKGLARAHALLAQYKQADRLLTRALRVEPARQDLVGMKAAVEARADFWPAAKKR